MNINLGHKAGNCSWGKPSCCACLASRDSEWSLLTYSKPGISKSPLGSPLPIHHWCCIPLAENCPWRFHFTSCQMQSLVHNLYHLLYILTYGLHFLIFMLYISMSCFFLDSCHTKEVSLSYPKFTLSFRSANHLHELSPGLLFQHWR